MRFSRYSWRRHFSARQEVGLTQSLIANPQCRVPGGLHRWFVEGQVPSSKSQAPTHSQVPIANALQMTRPGSRSRIHSRIGSPSTGIPDQGRRARSHPVWRRANVVSEPRERSEPAKRLASERAGESEGRSPSEYDSAVAFTHGPWWTEAFSPCVHSSWEPPIGRYRAGSSPAASGSAVAYFGGTY